MTSGKQLEVHNGRTVNMDIEHVIGLLVDQQFNEPYFEQAFWLLLKTFYPENYVHLDDGDLLPPVNALVNMDGLGMMLLDDMQIEWEVVTPSDDKFPVELYKWFDHIDIAVRVKTVIGWSKFAPGQTEGHGFLLGLMQGVRELSDANLNRPSEEPLH